jgi:hypothetical protein
MNRLRIALTVFTLGLVPTLATPALAENRREERMEHPRIAKAIHELEDAIAYMEAAPHDFGGHKAAAIQASRAALEQLRAALAYRAAEDTRRGR